MAVINRLSVLMAEKGLREKRHIEVKEIAAATGISRQTLHKYLRQDATRFDGEVIEALCKYFKCSINDLLVFESEMPGENLELQPDR